MHKFKNRQDAGKQLAQLLKSYKNKDAVVYALPRGGVVIAKEIASYLHAPLDLLYAHKIGHPHYEEYAIGAISERGYTVGELQLFDPEWLKEEKERQLDEIQRKKSLYKTQSIYARGKIAILVDDGVATGRTMEVGILELRSQHPAKIVIAVPVSPKSTFDKLKAMVNEAVGIEVVEDDSFMGAVGAYYDEFNQVEDQEVIDLLNLNSK
jgi:predicted phosphoribosyltransferase